MKKIRLVTEVPFPLAELRIGYEAPVAFLGSCFSVHMAKEMEQCGLSVWNDPFGISFNPLSISENLLFCIQEREIDSSDFFMDNELFHHFRCHSSSSGLDRENACSRLNQSIKNFRKVIEKASHLFVTFGTARVYSYNGDIVNNCHKLPSEKFERRLLSVDEIVETWKSTLSALRKLNPELYVAFSLSPVRHWKDGPEGNSLSKASLRLAIEQILLADKASHYIPSYEFMMDECRDYRFYADDLLHPSRMAISLLWERLSAAYLNPDEGEAFSMSQDIKKREAHRPMTRGTETEKRFLEKTQVLKEALEKELSERRWKLSN